MKCIKENKFLKDHIIICKPKIIKDEFGFIEELADVVEIIDTKNAFVKNKKIKKLDSTGFPLGVVANPKYQNQMIDLGEWDIFLIFSDALIETMDENGKYFDVEKFLLNILNSKNEFPTKKQASWLLNIILEEFKANYSKALDDDLTINVISKI